MISQKINSVSIFHYHLLPGGVTDVIILSTRVILTEMPQIEKVNIVFGRHDNSEEVEEKITRGLSADQKRKLTMVYFPFINYSEMVEEPLIAKTLSKALTNRFGGEENLWVIHNYHLGKNPAFTHALLIIADKGVQPLFLQIHDFPECSRYENLKNLKEVVSGQIYPQIKNVAYGVINSRDKKYLIQSGIEKENIFLLNNPVPLNKIAQRDNGEIKKALFKRYAKDFPAMKEDGKLLFYPVRSIRRKNILEAALLVKMIHEDVNLLISLPGVSEIEKPYSDLVEKAFREGVIPGLWGIGKDKEDEIINYTNFWAASDLVISSSIQEGFGYLYLNALHWEKPLLSRHLDIMDGFISLFKEESSHFYKRFPVPLTRDEENYLRDLYLQKKKNLSASTPTQVEDLMGLFDKMILGHQICFSYLPPEMQLDFLKRIDKDKDFKEQVRFLNHTTLQEFSRLLSSKVVNRDRVIEKTFGSINYAYTLNRIIKNMASGYKEITEQRDIQGNLEKIFFSPPYLRLLYGDGK